MMNQSTQRHRDQRPRSLCSGNHPVWSKISNALKRLGFRSHNFLAQLLSETSRACTIRVPRQPQNVGAGTRERVRRTAASFKSASVYERVCFTWMKNAQLIVLEVLVARTVCRLHVQVTSRNQTSGNLRRELATPSVSACLQIETQERFSHSLYCGKPILRTSSA